MDYTKLSGDILAAVGGKENVLGNMVCMTRLRIKVANPAKVNSEAVKAIDGVMGLVEDGDRLEVVLGPGVVNKVIVEFVKLTGIAAGDVSDESASQAAKGNKAAQKATYENKPVQRFLKKIANIFVPLLPGIISAGLINGIINVINFSTKKAFVGEWWFAAIWTMGWALFAYLPILAGENAAKEFGALECWEPWPVHSPSLTPVCRFLPLRWLTAKRFASCTFPLNFRQWRLRMVRLRLALPIFLTQLPEA